MADLKATQMSVKHDWETPRWLLMEVQRWIGGSFDLDAASSADNAVTKVFFTKDDDALSKDWVSEALKVRREQIYKDPIIWCNPPYGRQIGEWVKKAYEVSRAGATVALLIPARTDTRYWHDYAFKASEWLLIKGRLHFKNHGEPSISGAPFPSVVLIFRHRSMHEMPKVYTLKRPPPEKKEKTNDGHAVRHKGA